MGKFTDPGLEAFKEQRRKEDAARAKKQAEERKRIEAEIEALKPKSKSGGYNPTLAGIAALNESRNVMYAQVGGIKKFGKLPKSEQKKVQKTFAAEQEKQKKAKEAKIAALQKKLDTYPKPSQTVSSEFGSFNIGANLKEQDYEKEYFNMKGKELKTMVDNVVSSNPDKYGMKVSKGPNGFPIYTLTNKEKQAEMNARLAKAKTPKEKEAIKKKYEPLIDATVSDPRISLTSGGAGKYKNRISNAQGRAMMGPIQLGNFLEGKPYTNDHNKLGVKAVARHGKGNFFSQIGAGIAEVGGGLTKMASDILSGAAKTVSTVARAPIQLTGEATKSKELLGLSKNIQKEGDKAIDVAAPLATQIAASTFVPGYAATMAAGSASSALGRGDIGGALLGAGAAYLASGGGKALIGDLAAKLGTSTDVATQLVQTGMSSGKDIAEGNLEGAALAGLTALAGAGKIDPALATQLQAGLQAGSALVNQDPSKLLQAGLSGAGSMYGAQLAEASGIDLKTIDKALEIGKSTLSGDLKAKALQQLGSQFGLSPEQTSTLQNISSGNIGGALTSGLSAGLTGATAMYGGQLASEAGIDVDTIKEAEKIAKSALSGDLKAKALQQLSGAAGLSPEQTSILQAATSGNLKDELTNQAGQAAGLTNEQIQVGRTIASGDTKGLTNMASEYVIKKGDNFNAIAKKLGVDPRELAKANPQLKDINKISAGAKLILPQKVQAAVTGATTTADKFMKDAQGRTMYGANNAPILNPDYDEVLADARQLQKIKFDPTPVVGETVQQYADRMGLDPNVILEQNKGKGLSLGKAIPSNVEIALPEGFKPPTGEEKGFFDRMGDKVSGAWESITGGDKKAPDKGKEDKGFFDRATDFISDNKSGIIGGIAQGGSALLGYKAGQEAREDVEKLTNQQLADLQRQGKEFMEVSYDPERYKQERAFLQERIAKGGLTKEEEALQKQGDIRAARAAAAARLAGVEQQARLGGAAMGTSALASSLAGSQALLGEQSQTNLAREQAAAKNLESAIQRRGSLSTQETQERAELARQQGTFGLDRTTRIGGVRGDLGNLAFDEAAAKQRLYGTGADLITRGANTLFPSQEQPTQNLQTRAGAAQTIVNKPPSDKRQPPASTSTPPTQFNSRNLTAGVKPAEALKDPKAAGTQIVSNAQEIAKQKAKQEAERLKKEAEKKAKEALSPYIPEGIKNVLPSITKKEDDEEGFFGIKF